MVGVGPKLVVGCGRWAVIFSRHNPPVLSHPPRIAPLRIIIDTGGNNRVVSPAIWRTQTANEYRSCRRASEWDAASLLSSSDFTQAPRFLPTGLEGN